jgi:hypothetical protein
MPTDRRTLARASTVIHPLGGRIDTPLLVPSFSSKGFVDVRDEESEVEKALRISSEWITEAMLVSAYDIHYKFIPPPEALDGTPSVIIVDSGGYEAGIDHDLSVAAVFPYEPKPWTLTELVKVLDAWPDRYAAIFVSFDRPDERLPVAEQVAAARELFGRYPLQLSNMLLKPETKDQHTLKKPLEVVSAEPSIVAGFSFIGVTEKELGGSLLDRMVALARLRLKLDEAGVTAPIQVFGALDPVSSCLYFLSGAEVFDGLTWLRYGYETGLCIYRANYGALNVGIQTRDDLVRVKTITENYYSLQKLQIAMQKFANDRDFRVFEQHERFLSEAYDQLRTRVKEAP